MVALALITLLGPLSVHLFLPATPSIKDGFGLDEGSAELTVSIPLFMMALATLAYGSLSDRYGRRPVLLAGLVLFVSGSALAAFAGSFWLLLTGRMIQAAGGACGMTLARVMARDVYGTDRLVKVIAYLTMAYTLGPMISPPLGGLLVDVSSWRAVLGFAAVAGVGLMLMSYGVLHETHRERGAAGQGPALVSSYVQLFSSLRFTAFIMQGGFSSGTFFTMATAGAFLMTAYLGRPATEFGLFFLCFPVGFTTGNFVSSRFSGKVPIENMVMIGSFLMVVAVTTQSVLMLSDIVTPFSIFLPGFLLTFSQGIALPNAQAGALSVSRELAGTAAGIGVFMPLFCASAFVQFYGLVADGTPLPMVIIVLASASLSFAAGVTPFLLKRREARNAAS